MLSIPAMWVANFFKQRKWLQMTGLAAVVIFCVCALFFGISLIPEDIDLLATWETTYWQIQDFLNAYAKNFDLIYDITLMLLGEEAHLVTTFPIGRTALRFFGLLAVTAALLGIGLLIVRPLFYKMASTPFEYLKKQTPAKPNKVRTRRVSAVYNEFLIAVKSTNRMYANVGILIAVPILIFLLNKIFLAMNIRELGEHMVVAFNVLIVMLVVLNANCYAASIFSRDGRSSYLIKTQPSKYPILILSKLLPNTVFVFVSFGLFTNGLENFDKAYEEGLITKIFSTNMVYRTEELKKRPWFGEVDMSKYISYIIDTVNYDKSLSELLDPADRIKKFLAKNK
jgi:hypothetical protein